MEAAATDRDLQYLRHAIALSATAKARGKHPFAALIVDARDKVLAEAGNAFGWPDGDATGHAELIAVRKASRRFPPERLAQATLYSSAEPCAMCAGAVYWAGLRRVVYALSEARLLTLTGDHPENPTLALTLPRGLRPRAASHRGRRPPAGGRGGRPPPRLLAVAGPVDTAPLEGVPPPGIKTARTGPLTFHGRAAWRVLSQISILRVKSENRLSEIQ